MADFCKECNFDLFGRDESDFKGVGDKTQTLKEGEGFPVICEGCGLICVDHMGICLGECCCDHKPPAKIYSTWKEVEDADHPTRRPT